jgi:hypothetical protein
MQQFILSYGLTAVFVLMLAESACIPIPSEESPCCSVARSPVVPSRERTRT